MEELERLVLKHHEKGLGQRKIAEAIGISHWQVRNVYKKLNLKRAGIGVNRSLEARKSNFIETLKETRPYATYVSGYTGSTSEVTVKCKVCGEKERFRVDTFRKYREQCTNCARVEEQRQQEIKEILLEKYSNKKTYRTYRVRKHVVIKCDDCGVLVPSKTHGRKYCGACRVKRQRRHENRYKEEVRKQRLKNNGEYHEDITLDKLIETDNNICYLCGGNCDKGDSHWQSNAFYTGDSYPSVDHVIPISKGGTHTWDNVKLAHMICNSIKGHR